MAGVKGGSGKMRVSTLTLISAVFWIGLAIYFESFAGAAVFAAAHVLAFRIHILEVKLNKLLDHNNIFVSRQDIEDP